ncbi:aminoacyl-tRNA hydrolase [Ectothiorhodospira lacustris]|uniref:aminoacyl-tRNA hydrolase n=1 Tax=Ectothiorhodospira lacustris TaxID=2899127 RepID=UPI001EE87426|nr:aminoacyl-tRNA hydrolase [Ectothiorhodospira lacustris]MCG5508837.1 aminoacyl-tRNA hydrolase [Ectothiorhodospira lacustris]MCG5520628.1 aminoacyl-tRNA hydrolase [Ectothiorhodospira lacustris]
MADKDTVQVIAGLGNPGSDYAMTRHNAGFWFVDELARRHGGRFRLESKFAGETARIHIEGQEIWLIKPQTFMNHSGQPIRLLTQFYKIPITSVLVAHDEIDLPPGTARLKRGGGHGGHNGLRDIMSHQGQDFMRLRLGVGHPGHREQVVGFVLNRPSREEESLITDAIDRAADLMPLLLSEGLQKATNRLHSA